MHETLKKHCFQCLSRKLRSLTDCEMKHCKRFTQLSTFFPTLLIFQFITINILNRTSMSLSFSAIQNLCCRNSKEHSQQQNQQNSIQRYLSPRSKATLQMSQTPIKRVATSNFPVKQTQVANFRAQPQLRQDMRVDAAKFRPKHQRANTFTPFQNEVIINNHAPKINFFHSTQPLPISPPTLNQALPIKQISFAGLQQNNALQISKVNSPRIIFTIKNKQAEPRHHGKRLKTQEQETEYSSKHSQIAFKNCTVAAESQEFPSLVTFKKHNSYFFENEVIFQQQNESIENNQSINCKEVSAKEQIDHSFNNELLNNARTIQSILTSNEIRSKSPSIIKSVQGNKQLFFHSTPANNKQNFNYPFSSQFQNSLEISKQNTFLSQNHGDSPPPSPNLSPKISEEVDFSPNAQSNQFYGTTLAKKFKKSPKISVLELNQSEQQQQGSESQQLRDVIDNNFLQSQYCSRTNSPLISINQSLKNLNEERDKKIVSFFQFSPQHSRQASDQLALFKETRTKLQRTNTIESIGSHSSQHSCLDVKFMQHMRGKRGVSRLV